MLNHYEQSLSEETNFSTENQTTENQQKEKDWDESPEGKNFTRNAYDFYQLSEDDVWFVRDLSISIPYDYEFVKKYQGNRK